MPIHPLWLVVIVVLVLIIFGPGRLPELGGAVGKAMREFRKASSELTGQVTAATQANPPAPAPAAPAVPAESAGTVPASTSEANPPQS
ncbi:MAG TPA: twin-arginine translocase TatA/TatE family subunit [Patescibacteria group bacterium]|nr:twin-arginine translocase TatA/TatE family subunit [Patescibacteria group bacterium]